MSAALARLTPTRAPLTAEDRACLAGLASSQNRVSTGIAVVAGLGLLVSLTQGLAGIIYAVPSAGLLLLARWLRRGGARMAAATEKLVYAGTITAKRSSTEVISSGTSSPPSEHKKWLLSLDGVELDVSETIFREAEQGSRIELYSLPDGGTPFRAARA